MFWPLKVWLRTRIQILGGGGICKKFHFYLQVNMFREEKNWDENDANVFILIKCRETKFYSSGGPYRDFLLDIWLTWNIPSRPILTPKSI